MQKFLAVLTVALFVATIGVAQAAIIDFEDLNGLPDGVEAGIGSLPEGYAGFNWTNAYWLNKNIAQNINGTGYEYGTFGQISMITYWYNTITMASNSLFNFYSAYITSVIESQTMRVIGYEDGTVKWSTDVTVNYANPSLVTLDFTGIDKITFEPATGRNIVIDNMNVAVPVPSPVWLLSSGLIGLVWLRRKFRK